MIKTIGSDKFLTRTIQASLFGFATMVLLSNLWGLGGVDLARTNPYLYMFFIALLAPTIFLPFIAFIWLLQRIKERLS